MANSLSQMSGMLNFADVKMCPVSLGLSHLSVKTAFWSPNPFRRAGVPEERRGAVRRFGLSQFSFYFQGQVGQEGQSPIALSFWRPRNFNIAVSADKKLNNARNDGRVRTDAGIPALGHPPANPVPRPIKRAASDLFCPPQDKQSPGLAAVRLVPQGLIGVPARHSPANAHFHPCIGTTFAAPRATQGGPQ
jgi:hypothetical protein